MTEQATFLAALDQFQEVGQGVELAPELLQSGAEMRTQIEGFQVLIPLVGAFNAGKTSLVNAHLRRQEKRKRLLPTAIVPQTALATEIYPAPSAADERIELLGEDDAVLRSVDLEGFGQIEKQTLKTEELPAHYAKAYLHEADQLGGDRKVLVDMPGLDSGFRTHNAAIQRYLPRGGYFIMVVNADHGALRQSEIGQLREFLAQEVEFTVLVNKIDKKTETDADAIVSHIKGQVQQAFEKSAPVLSVSAREGNVQAFRDTLDAIDFDRALRGFWRPDTVRLIDEAIQSLHTRYSALNLSTAESDRVIAELERRQKALEDKLRQDERDIKSRYSHRAVDRIVRAVRDSIRDNASSLAETYLHGGTEAGGREINELVRQTLNHTVEEERSKMQQSIVGHYQADIDAINAEYEGFTSTDAPDLPPNAGTIIIDAGRKSARNFREARDNIKTDTFFTAAAGVFAATTAVVTPWLEAVLILLPSILRFLSARQAERERQEQIERQKQELPMRIRSSVAPKIASELRPKVEADYAKIAQEMLAQLRQQVETTVSGIRADINKSQTERDKRKQSIQGQKDQLRAALKKLTEIKKPLEAQP